MTAATARFAGVPSQRSGTGSPSTQGTEMASTWDFVPTEVVIDHPGTGFPIAQTPQPIIEALTAHTISFATSRATAAATTRATAGATTLSQEASMTTTPTPEALRHRAAAHRWALAGEWAFTAASSAVNVTVIHSMGGSLLRILIGALAPVLLAQMSRLLAKLLQGGLTDSGVHGGVALATAAAVTAIGGGAFYMSFETLRRAAEPDHGGSAWVFPATLDAAIVVCAAVLAVIAWADEQDQRAGVPARITLWNRLTARFGGEQLAAQEQVTAAQVTSPEPVTVPPVSAQLTAPDAQLTSPEDDAITAPIPAAQQGEQQPVTSNNSADDHPAEPATHQDAQVVGDEQLPTAQPESAGVTTAQLPNAATSGEQSAGEQQIDPAQEAAVLRQRGNSRLAEDDLTDLIARIAAGESYSAISEATGISRNTVRKVASMVPTAPEPEPALA